MNLLLWQPYCVLGINRVMRSTIWIVKLWPYIINTSHIGLHRMWQSWWRSEKVLLVMLLSSRLELHLLRVHVWMAIHEKITRMCLWSTLRKVPARILLISLRKNRHPLMLRLNNSLGSIILGMRMLRILHLILILNYIMIDIAWWLIVPMIICSLNVHSRKNRDPLHTQTWMKLLLNLGNWIKVILW